MLKLKGLLCSLFGLALAGVIAAAVLWDDVLVTRGRQTISAWSLAFGERHVWYPFGLAAFAAAVVVCLATHLWYAPEGEAFAWSMAGLVLGGFLGFVLGLLFFLQGA